MVAGKLSDVHTNEESHKNLDKLGMSFLYFDRERARMIKMMMMKSGRG